MPESANYIAIFICAYAKAAIFITIFAFGIGGRLILLCDMNPERGLELIAVGIITNWIGDNNRLSLVVIFLWLSCYIDRKYLDGAMAHEFSRLLGTVRNFIKRML